MYSNTIEFCAIMEDSPEAYCNTNEVIDEQNGAGLAGQDAGVQNKAPTESAQIQNGDVGDANKQNDKPKPKQYSSIDRENPERRIRPKSLYQKYEEKVPHKHKIGIANLVSTLMILTLWILFIIPSGVLVWALIDYTLHRKDPLSNDTVSMVFNADLCQTNTTVQTAIEEFTRVAQGRYNTTNFSCISTFVSNGSQCVPECLAQYPGGDGYFYLSFISVPILSFITLVAATIGASTWMCIKSLWKFPHIISLYLILCVFGQALMLFGGSLYRKRFFCSSRDLYVSQANPTIQCQIEGPIFHFFVLAFILWYICDIFNIVYVTLYPMRANNFFKHSIKIHILQSFISWGLPLLIIGTVLASTFKYHMYIYPITCLPNQFALLITVYIPGVAFSLLSGTGIIIFGLVLYKRQNKMGKASSTNMYRSLLIHLILYTIALSTQIFIILMEFTVTSYNLNLTSALQMAFNYCITALYRSPECCVMSYNYFPVPFLSFLNETAICIWGIVALSVVWVKEAKTMWTKILTCAKCRQVYHEHKSKSTDTPND